MGKKRSADEKAGEQRRLIRGFKTSYRRLNWDKPASTITMNSGVISSDMKGHRTKIVCCQFGKFSN